MIMTTVYRNDADKIVTEDSIVSEDVGVGGVRVRFPHRLPMGKIIDLKVFFFSDPIPLPAKGRVMWSSEREVFETPAQEKGDQSNKEFYWMGIQFVDIDAFHRERILRWIKREFQMESL